MWEINTASQILTFLYSIILGFSIGIFFDFPRSLRPFIKHKNVYVFFSDLLFWILSAFLTFCFYLIFTNGELRGFVIVGMFVGFILERLTLSLILVKILKKIIHILKRAYIKFITYRNRKIDKFLCFLIGTSKKGKNVLKKYIKCAKKP